MVLAGEELPAFRVDFHSKAGFSAETFSLLSNDLLSFSRMGKYWCHYLLIPTVQTAKQNWLRLSLIMDVQLYFSVSHTIQTSY